MTADNTTMECRYHGRDFTTGEMALMRDLIAASPQQTRAGPAREFCRAIGWVKPDGELRDGIIALPPPRHGPWPRRVPEFGPETDPPQTPMPVTLDAVRPIRLSGSPASAVQPVSPETASSPAGATSVTRPSSVHRCAMRSGTGRAGRCGHARILRRRMEDRTPRCLHRMVSGSPGAEPVSRDQQCPISHHAMDPDSRSGLPHPLPGAAPTCARHRYVIRPANRAPAPKSPSRTAPPGTLPGRCVRSTRKGTHGIRENDFAP